jgi:acetoin utilization deacetylase AcuC-like enzyme
VSHHYPVPIPAGHPFLLAKYTALRGKLLDESVLHADEIHESQPAPVEWLRLAHEDSYVTRVLSGELEPMEIRRLGLPWSRELTHRARAVIYGTVMAAQAAVDHGIAANMAGGTHHAYPGRAEAYCLFNDIATAIAVLRRRGLARRPLIVDLDVHQGNGTALFFAHDESVFTFSMHAADNYPRHKERSSLDVGLPAGCEDASYLELLEGHLPRVFSEHGPDLILYQAGVDGLAEDRLGHLSLTHAGLEQRDRLVFDECAARGTPVVFMLGGGYARPIEESVTAHANVWRAARRVRDGGPVFDADVSASVPEPSP